MKKVVYLDNHSATLPDIRVVDAMLPYIKEKYANLQSLHSLGLEIKDAVENARKNIAELINVKPEEIIFTSNASESNNLALKGIALGNKDKGKHIVVSSIEHYSILNSAKWLQHLGFEISYVKVDKFGLVEPDELKKLLQKDTILVSIQHANTEIGTIQNLKELVKIVKENSNAIFHTDAVGTVGIIPVDISNLGVDCVTISPIGMYGPKGIAGLVVKKNIKILPLIDGGIQEHSLRAGTENVPGIVGFGKAAEIIKTELETNYNKMLSLRDKLINEIRQKVSYVYLNGHPIQRLPNNINISIEFIEGEALLLMLDVKGILATNISSGAPKTQKMSHVLEAIGIDPAIGQGTVIFTLSKYNSDKEINYVIEQLCEITRVLRDRSPLYSYFLKTGERKKTGVDIVMREIKNKYIAIANVSKDEQKNEYKIFRDLLLEGYNIVGIYPENGEILGEKLYHNIKELPRIPDMVIITVIEKEVIEKIVEECIQLGVKEIWMQPGSESEIAIKNAEQHGIKVTFNTCFMEKIGLW